MKKIMFVCHGNICRSPMAEFIFKKLAKDAGRSAEFSVCSSATSDEEIYMGVGNPVYPPARAVLLRNGIDPGSKRAVQLSRADYGKYDLFIGMDSANLRNMRRIFGSDPEGKIRKHLELLSGDDVSDPWYSRDFSTAYRDIYEGCAAWLDYLG